MIALVSNTINNYLNLDWLTGPFLNKELRVSSRRRRNYFLRAAYITVLSVFVAITWLSVFTFEFSGNGIYLKSRLAQAGKTIIYMIVWFQFIAAQLVAVIMFCNSISDEIYHRTLGVLLTTPVSSFQIVAGKLLSKLLQIILLLAISLPLLAIIRIFGGVSWNFIFKSLCITFAAVIFAGSVSMFFSVLFRKAHVVIIMTILFFGIFYGTMRFFSAIISELFRSQFRGLMAIFFSLDPFFLLSRVSEEMLNPGRSRIGSLLVLDCFFILLASFLILFASARILRNIALAHAIGQKTLLEKIFSTKRHNYSKSSDPNRIVSEGKMRHVRGPVIVWKEMITKYSSREKIYAAVVISIELIMIIAMYLFPFIAVKFGYDEAHHLYVYTFMGIGILSTAIFSAGCITSEKEAQTWPLLLMTTLSERQILLGKFIGILRRSFPMWILLFIYFFPFLNIEDVGIIALLILIVMMIAIIFFLGMEGIYFSTRFKNTSVAFFSNIAFIILIWFLLPVILDYRSNGIYMRFVRHFFNKFWIGNPFIQAITIVTSNFNNGYRYIMWPDRNRNIFDSVLLTSYISMVYITAGFIFAWRAKCGFRKRIL